MHLDTINFYTSQKSSINLSAVEITFKETIRSALESLKETADTLGMAALEQEALSFNNAFSKGSKGQAAQTTQQQLNVHAFALKKLPCPTLKALEVYREEESFASFRDDTGRRHQSLLARCRVVAITCLKKSYDRLEGVESDKVLIGNLLQDKTTPLKDRFAFLSSAQMAEPSFSSMLSLASRMDEACKELELLLKKVPCPVFPKLSGTLKADLLAHRYNIPVLSRLISEIALDDPIVFLKAVSESPKNIFGSVEKELKTGISTAILQVWMLQPLELSSPKKLKLYQQQLLSTQSALSKISENLLPSKLTMNLMEQLLTLNDTVITPAAVTSEDRTQFKKWLDSQTKIMGWEIKGLTFLNESADTAKDRESLHRLRVWVTVLCLISETDRSYHKKLKQIFQEPLDTKSLENLSLCEEPAKIFVSLVELLSGPGSEEVPDTPIHSNSTPFTPQTFQVLYISAALENPINFFEAILPPNLPAIPPNSEIENQLKKCTELAFLQFLTYQPLQSGPSREDLTEYNQQIMQMKLIEAKLPQQLAPSQLWTKLMGHLYQMNQNTRSTEALASLEERTQLKEWISQLEQVVGCSNGAFKFVEKAIQENATQHRLSQIKTWLMILSLIIATGPFYRRRFNVALREEFEVKSLENLALCQEPKKTISELVDLLKSPEVKETPGTPSTSTSFLMFPGKAARLLGIGQED